MDPVRVLPPVKPESSFLTLAETLSALIALIQGEKIVYVNPAGCRLLGRPPEYFNGRRFWDVVHPDDRDAAAARGLSRQAGVPQPTRFTERLVHADGHIVWVDYSVDVILLDGVVTTLVTGHDISEQKKAEESLRKSERMFRGLYKQAPVMMWSVGWDNRFKEVSDALLKKLGYERSEIVGRDSLELLTPESRRRMDEMIARYQAARVWSMKNVPLQVRCKNGDILEIQFSSVPDMGEDGQPSGWICVAADLSEITRTQEALKLSDARFRLAFQNAAVGKAIAGIDFKLHQVNKAYCDMLGYGEPEILTRSTLELTHPDDVAEQKVLLQRLLSGDLPSGRIIKRYLHKEGRIVWGDLTLTLIRDADGRPAFFVGEVVDITERKRAEEALRDREAMLAESQAIAHVGSWELLVPQNKIVWSDETYRIWGVDPARFDSSLEAVVARIHPDDRARTQEIVFNALGKGAPFEYEYRIVRDTGEVRMLWSTGRVDLDASGKVVRFYGITQDITERTRAEELLRDREAKLAEAQRVAKIGSWEYDIAGDRSTWSEEFYRIYRLDPGMKHPTKEEFFSKIHPGDRERVAGLVGRAIVDGTPFEYEARVVLDDGEVKWIHSIARTELDGGGKPVRIYGIAQDITDRKRAEALVRDREANLAAAQRIAHIGSWEWDVVTGGVVWSDEMYRIVGADPLGPAPSYDDYLARVHPDDRAGLVSAVERGLKDGRSFEFENRLVRADGVRSVWTRCRMETDAAGKVIRMYGTTQDLTERKASEEALRTSEQRFRNLYTQAPVLMTVVGPDLKFREVSNFWLQTFGYERSEVIGRDGYAFITPESQAHHRAAVEQAMRSGEPVIRNLPIQGIRKDGTRVDVLTTSLAEVDGKGRFLGALTVGVNLSDVRRADEAVRESEERYRAMVEHAPEAIVVADGDDGKFVDVNEQALRLFRRSRAQLLSLGPAECSPPFQPDGRPSPEKAQDMIRRTAVATQVFEWTHTDGEGRDIPCLIHLSKMPHRTRNLIRATIVDISRQKGMEEKLRQDDRMAAIGVLAAGVAHEIGNPLLALSMAAQSLERKTQDEYSLKKLTLIREHIERISRIVRQMSDLARAPAQTRGPVDLNRVLERSMEVVRYDKRAKAVAIDVTPCGDLPFVQAAEDQLVQVSLNLALNALDAVAANGPDRPKTLSICVRCVDRDGRRAVRASFRDSGPGIPESAKAKIFQPFFTTKEPGKGTGLGLSVSYRIIEEHQGTLGFESDPGKGTEFYFELPVREKP